MTKQELVAEMDEALQIPGVTQPIKTRVDRLATGIKTPVGIKIAGEDIPTLERIGEELEKTLRPVEGTKSVYSEQAGPLLSWPAPANDWRPATRLRTLSVRTFEASLGRFSISWKRATRRNVERSRLDVRSDPEKEW